MSDRTSGEAALSGLSDPMLGGGSAGGGQPSAVPVSPAGGAGTMLPHLGARSLLAIAVLLAVMAGAWSLHVGSADGRALSFSLLIGAAFGVVLQRSRFCFLCNFRDLIERRDPRGVIAILVALAVGTILYQVVIMAWMPVPQPDRLPPGAHIGPVGPALAIAAAVFGAGMAISGSCISAHLYRLGEGSPTSFFALFGAALGFVLGFVSWNPLYLAFISENAAVWLPHRLGYAGALVASLVVLVALAVLVLAVARPQTGSAPEPLSLRSVYRRVFVDRWPAVTGGVAVGVIAMAAYFRVAPLGVTAELGSLARTAGAGAGLIPDTLFGLDGLRGCATVVKQALLSNNGLFVLGLVGGSFAAALQAGQFRPSRPTLGHILRGLSGGVLMGWGAMVGLGCTVGVLLSGIHAGALSGWVFLVFCAAGTAATLWIARRLS